MPLGLHLPDLLVVLAIALLIFGPKKLPEIGASIGKSVSAFKKGIRGLEENLQNDTEDKNVQNLLEQRKSELDVLEYELADKKATASAYATNAQAEHTEAVTFDSKLG